MLCEMCGSKDAVFRADLEGSELNLCENCSKFGKVIKRVEKPAVVEKKAEKRAAKPAEPVEELVEVIVPNYSKLIRDKRESMGLTQKEFAQRINEKESLVHNIETGRFEPSIKLAQKMERFLKIKLIEEYKEELKPRSAKSEELTIGDFIRVRK